jgi:prepilin-type N-terminal cleavage/methylation domain-containing protein
MMTRRREGKTETRRKRGAPKLRFSGSPRLCVDETDAFTLLEVLIAVAITSIIVAALYSAFSLSRKAVDAVDDSLLRLQECRSVLDVLKREIESSPYDPTKSYTVFKLDDRDFYGKQASQLVFTSFSQLRPGLAKITYAVEENEGKLTLKKKVDPAYGQAVETKSVELIENLESFTVEAGYKSKWVKTWDSAMTNTYPEEIRISLKMVSKEGEAPFTVSEIARLRIGMKYEL